MRKFLKTIGVFSMLLIGMGSIGLKVNAEGETSYGARNITQKSHVRYDVTEQTTPSGTDFGTNWQENPMPTLLSKKASFVRLLLHVDAPGVYQMGVRRASAEYPVKLYVNGTLQMEGDMGTTGWVLTRNDYPVTLQEGNNVIVFQFNNWGGITDFIFPNEITVIKHDESDGIYYTVDSKLNATCIVAAPGSDKTLHDFDATVIPDPFKYDETEEGLPNYEWMGSAEFKITPKATTKSLKVHYSSSDFSTGAGTGLMMSFNGSEPTFVALPTGEVNTPLTKIVDVGSLGFNFESENTVLIFNDVNNSGKLRVTALELSEEEPEPIVHTYPIGAETLKTKVNLRGRQFAKENAIVMDWSASGIDFNVTGTRVVDAVFNTPNGGRIATSLNGGQATLTQLPAGTNKVRLLTGLSLNETYNVRIFKASEAAGSLCELVSLDLEVDANVTKPVAKDLNFFFLGSSTSCGNQIDIDKNIDAYGAFPRVLADAFDADFDVVSCSGRGLMQGYNSEENWAPSQNNQLKHLFDKTSHFRDENMLYEHTSKDFDVIVLSIGHNDLGVAIMETFQTTIVDFTAEVKTFHTKVRELYPNAYILYEYGHYVNRRFNEEFGGAINEIKTTDSNTGYVYVPLYGGGADSHPSYAQHESIAKALSPFVAESLGVENPMGSTPIRLEAENATLLGNASRSSDTDPSTPWSNAGYVGSLEPGSGVNITDPNNIIGDGSDVKILSLNFNAPVSGEYRFAVSYATQVEETHAFVKIDNKPWVRINLFNTTGWKSMQESEFLYFNLAPGVHKILLTGACKDGSWVNYDYIEMTRVGDATSYHVFKPADERVTISGVEDEVIAGEDIAFSVIIHEEYTQSNIIVKVNGIVVTPVNELYHVENVSDDITITVEGLRKNIFTLTFKDGDTIISEEQYEVGAPITAPENPTKDGYTFNGWDRPIPETMPNGDLVISATWIEGEAPKPRDTKRIAAIVGGSIGGVLVLGGGVVLTVWGLNKRRKRAI